MSQHSLLTFRTMDRRARDLSLPQQWFRIIARRYQANNDKIMIAWRCHDMWWCDDAMVMMRWSYGAAFTMMMRYQIRNAFSNSDSGLQQTSGKLSWIPCGGYHLYYLSTLCSSVQQKIMGHRPLLNHFSLLMVGVCVHYCMHDTSHRLSV